MQDSAEDFRVLVSALRSALDTSADADRPGRLRPRLEAALGPEASGRLRPQVHQLVAAAEENLPADLRRITPLTPQSLQRLSRDLATARGWTPGTAQRTTQLWANALGFGDLAASSWPRARPAPGAVPLAPDVTLPPPAAQEPQTPVDPWPPMPKVFAAHRTSPGGEAALGGCLAYSGMDLRACVALLVGLTVLLCLPIVFLGVAGLALPAVGILGARVLVSRLGRGALVASAAGLEFTPYDASLRRPHPEQTFSAPWALLHVEAGSVSSLHLAGRRVQVGPRGRAFVDNAARLREEAR